jgi:hypothetical protein
VRYQIYNQKEKKKRKKRKRWGGGRLLGVNPVVGRGLKCVSLCETCDGEGGCKMCGGEILRGRKERGKEENKTLYASGGRRLQTRKVW